MESGVAEVINKVAEKEALLHFAGQLDQLYQNVEAWAKLSSTSIFAGHEAMVALMNVRSASRYLQKTAARYND
jgi:hypothetical protein